MERINLPKIVVRHLLPPPVNVKSSIRPHHCKWELGRYKDIIVSTPVGTYKEKVWHVDQEGEGHNLVLKNTNLQILST